MALSSLPRLDNFLEKLLGRNVEATGDSNCTICLERLRKDSRDVLYNVVGLPCQHLLHFRCLLDMTAGYATDRNKCPVCRKALFELNVLPPAKEALRKKEEITYDDPATEFLTDAYRQLLQYADYQFDRQQLAPEGRADYAEIPKRVGWIWWNNDGLENGYYPICYEHSIAGHWWIELIVAERVRDRLEDANIEYSKAVQEFKDAHTTIKEMYNEQFLIFGDGDESEGHPIPSEEPASTSMAMRGPEAASETSPQAAGTTSGTRLVRG